MTRKKARAQATARTKSALPPERSERTSQVTLQMRESLHQELARKAFDSGMTMRGFIMRALKRSGLHVTDTDLVDATKADAAMAKMHAVLANW